MDLNSWICVWFYGFGFFKLDLNSWIFSFLFPQHDSPPSCAGCPSVEFVQMYCFGVPAAERSAWSKRALQQPPELPSQHSPRAVHGHWDVAQDVPWELRALCRGWSEKELWVAKQSRCFGPTGLVLSSFFLVFFCIWSEANRLELLGKWCQGSLCSALVAARSTLWHLAVPYSSPCRPCHSAILAVRVAAVPAVPPSLLAATVPAAF